MKKLRCVIAGTICVVSFGGLVVGGAAGAVKPGSLTTASQVIAQQVAHDQAVIDASKLQQLAGAEEAGTEGAVDLAALAPVANAVEREASSQVTLAEPFADSIIDASKLQKLLEADAAGVQPGGGAGGVAPLPNAEPAIDGLPTDEMCDALRAAPRTPGRGWASSDPRPPPRVTTVAFDEDSTITYTEYYDGKGNRSRLVIDFYDRSDGSRNVSTYERQENGTYDRTTVDRDGNGRTQRFSHTGIPADRLPKVPEGGRTVGGSKGDEEKTQELGTSTKDTKDSLPLPGDESVPDLCGEENADEGWFDVTDPDNLNNFIGIVDNRCDDPVSGGAVAAEGADPIVLCPQKGEGDPYEAVQQILGGGQDPRCTTIAGEGTPCIEDDARPWRNPRKTAGTFIDDAFDFCNEQLCEGTDEAVDGSSSLSAAGAEFVPAEELGISDALPGLSAATTISVL